MLAVVGVVDSVKVVVRQIGSCVFWWLEKISFFYDPDLSPTIISGKILLYIL